MENFSVSWHRPDGASCTNFGHHPRSTLLTIHGACRIQGVTEYLTEVKRSSNGGAGEGAHLGQEDYPCWT